MDSDLITIGQASKMIGVSIKTLHRWDEEGKLSSIRKKKETGYRYYKKKDIENYNVKNLFRLAKFWVEDDSGFEPLHDFYCLYSSVFTARMRRMESELMRVKGLKIFSLISSIAAEIGDNSFNHNLSNWPDIPGIIFAYNLNKRIVVLADRGRGILTTLRNVEPDLANHQEALILAFTKFISGRPGEGRGIGLKFVKNVVIKNEIGLFFQTGNAYIDIKKQNSNFKVKKSKINFRGCLALIKF